MRRRQVAITLAVLTVGCSSTEPSVRTSGPSTTAAVTAAPNPPSEEPVVPEGFERVAATVTKADGETCDVCLWLADSADLRVRGLMNVTDLGNADGMAFVYPQPHTGNFWMKDTVMPLSIAFFGVGGRHLGEFDMEPCTADPCPRYRTAREFVVAVETHRGELAELGIGPGSSLELTDLPCP